MFLKEPNVKILFNSKKSCYKEPFGAVKNDENIVRTSVNTTLGNKKIGWGIKRAQNYEQPDLGVNNKKLIDMIVKEYN